MSLFVERAISVTASVGKSAVMPAVAALLLSTASVGYAQQTSNSTNHQTTSPTSQAQAVRTSTTANLVSSSLKAYQTQKAGPSTTQGGPPPSEYQR